MSKIYIELRSGLGNQLFQFSFAYSLASEFNCDLILCPAFFDSGWKYFLKKSLRREARSFRLPVLLNKTFHIVSGEAWEKSLRSSSSIQIIDERSSDIGRIRELCAGRNDIYLRGYWQDSGYFDKYRNELINLFIPKFNLSEKYNVALGELRENVVGIHVRRGDFLTNTAFGACTVDYYVAAMALIRKRVDNPYFIIFTNDRKWVASTFPKEMAYAIYSGKRSNTDIEEMLLMSKMKSLIISNSTYSWWSAFLNEVSGSHIICPETWFLSSLLQQRSRGLILKKWTTIDNRLEIRR